MAACVSAQPVSGKDLYFSLARRGEKKDVLKMQGVERNQFQREIFIYWEKARF